MRPRHIPRAVVPAAFIILAAAAALLLVISNRAARADAPEVSWSVDVVPGAAGHEPAPTVDTTRAAVNVGDCFGVDVVVDTYDGSPTHQSYQVALDYSDVFLEPIGIPASWGSAPTADTGSCANTSGNLHPMGAAACDPSPSTDAVTSEDETDNQGPAGTGASILMTCFDATNTAMTNAGDVARFFFQCAAAGTALFDLRASGDNFLLDTSGLVQMNDHQHNATVECAAAGPTDTPTNTASPTATNTPGPTDTPTNTPVATDTPTETNTPGPTDTPTNTPVATDTPTATNTPGPTDTPTQTNTPGPTDTPTNTPVATDTPTATNTPGPTDTPTNTPVPPTNTVTNTPVPGTPGAGGSGPSGAPDFEPSAEPSVAPGTPGAAPSATAAAPRPTATRPGGGAGAGGIVPPSTGTGGPPGSSITWYMASLAAAGAVALGLAMRLRNRRR